MRLFSSPSDATAQTGDAAWLRAMLDFEAALARALADCGLASAAAAEEIERVCGGRAIGTGAGLAGPSGDEGAPTPAADDWDLDALGEGTARDGTPVPALLAQLRARLSDEAKAVLHRGATSQDVVDTAAMLVAKRALAPLRADLDAAADAAGALAERHRHDLAVGRTLLQQALPITFGLRAANWLGGLDDAAVRLGVVAEERLAVQLGGAAGTLASLGGAVASLATPGGGKASSAPPRLAIPSSTAPDQAIGSAASPGTEAASATTQTGDTGTTGLAVAEALARRLDLPAPAIPWQTNRSRVVELAAALGQAAGAAGKVGTDVVLLAQTEVGEVAEGGEGGGSSTLPHKRNPTSAVTAIAAARRTPALVATLLSAMPGEEERAAGAWQSEPEALDDLLRLTATAVAATRKLLENLEVFPERMRENLGATDGLVMAESLASALGEKLGRAKAQELVGEASKRAAAEQLPLFQIATETPAIVDPLGRDDITAALDPVAYLGATDTLITRALAAHRTR